MLYWCEKKKIKTYHQAVGRLASVANGSTTMGEVTGLDSFNWCFFSLAIFIIKPNCFLKLTLFYLFLVFLSTFLLKYTHCTNPLSFCTYYFFIFTEVKAVGNFRSMIAKPICRIQHMFWVLLPSPRHLKICRWPVT